MSIFAERLSSELKEQNISQKYLAEKTQITTATISRYITGQRNPTADNASRIAVFLNVSVDYLLGMSDNKHQKQVKKSDEEKLKDFLETARLHFMEANEEDQDKIMRCLQDVFWETKEINRKKYNPNKNKPKTN